MQAHPYPARKGVQAHGLWQDRRGNLLVPMRDAGGHLWGTQTISAEGRKLYMRDGRKQEMHAMLGELRDPGVPLLIAESFATAATLHEATGLPVAVAFDACNLLAVAKAHRERDPARPLIFAADNDHGLPLGDPPLPNVGKEKAETAAREVGGTVLLPHFALDEAGTDWNDWAAKHGKRAVRELVEAVPTLGQAMRDAARRQI
ncbi:MAG: toprim domain-containing protein, partial [Acetobacteraceae bacterium]|nr:toprim domain-containing protein [Acetobacteraceae bacterium]